MHIEIHKLANKDDRELFAVVLRHAGKSYWKEAELRRCMDFADWAMTKRAQAADWVSAYGVTDKEMETFLTTTVGEIIDDNA